MLFLALFPTPPSELQILLTIFCNNEAAFSIFDLILTTYNFDLFDLVATKATLANTHQNLSKYFLLRIAPVSYSYTPSASITR